jgi:tRNA-Thr(GGU) m(6)t(6)A37 methyltransferase TsaA
MSDHSALDPFEVRPIGVIRTPFDEKAKAPRQPPAARGTPGRIELVSGMGLEHAVEDLAAWDHIWVVFLFHLNRGWKPKVLPPRSSVKRGVLATRSPHRPNPIGISVVRLVRVEGLIIDVLDVDMIDGTPVLDVKPYVPYADSVPDAGSGWLEDPALPSDPREGYEVVFSELARAELDWLASEHGVQIERPLAQALSLGPEPHPYRRIRKVEGDQRIIALKSWRARFAVDEGARRLSVLRIESGYRKGELATAGDPEIAIHRAFTLRFPAEAG